MKHDQNRTGAALASRRSGPADRGRAGYANSVGVNETTKNIFGCAGNLGGDANKCAALNRHVADLPEDQQHDPARFYPTGPANYYAKFWHDHNIDGKAYGFPYDDVAEQASYVSHEVPQWLVVAVGW